MSEKKKNEVKTTRKRTTSLVEVFCGVGDCEYSSICEHSGHVTKHRQHAHQLPPAKADDKSIMDKSVSISEVFASTISSGSLGDKTSQELYVLFPSVSQSQSPEKATRDEIMRKANEVMQKNDEGTESEEEPDVSVSLMAGETVDETKDFVSEDYVTTLENVTAAPTQEETHELSLVSDSLSLTYSGNRDNQEVKGLESELQAKNRSHQDALSEVNERMVKVATIQRKLVDSPKEDSDQRRVFSIDLVSRTEVFFQYLTNVIIPSNFQFGAQQIPIGTFAFDSQVQNLQPAHQACGRGPQEGGAVQDWQPQMPTSEELMRARQEAAMQHQTLSRRLQLDQMRAELSNVQSQIHASHSQPPGTNIRRLYEDGKFNPGL